MDSVVDSHILRTHPPRMVSPAVAARREKSQLLLLGALFGGVVVFLASSNSGGVKYYCPPCRQFPSAGGAAAVVEVGRVVALTPGCEIAHMDYISPVINRCVPPCAI
jgi:hypothetical protein